MNCPQSGMTTCRVARTALTSSTPMPSVPKVRAVLPGQRQAGRRSPRPIGGGVVTSGASSSTADRDHARHQMDAVRGGQAGVRHHHAAQERPDEQPDPVDAAQGRHRPGPQRYGTAWAT